MIISYSRRFVFVHIHKTGGDSITAALLPLLAKNDLVLKHDWAAWFQKLHAGRGLPTLDHLRKHSPALAISNVVPQELWTSFFKFAFVRHPIGRTISLYCYAARKLGERRRVLPRNAWYLTPAGRSHDPYRWRSVRAFIETDSFSDFIRHPLLRGDASMMSQWDLLSDPSGKVLVDFIGSFETLQEDFHHVQDKLGVPRTPIGWRNASSSESRRMEVQVNLKDRLFLAERFSADFTHFAYNPFDNA